MIKKIELLVHIKNKEIFNEFFPDIPNTPKVHPYWNYTRKKDVIKIDLYEEIVHYLNKEKTFEYSVDDIFEIKQYQEYMIGNHLDFFKKFGNTFLYITYVMNGKEYINFYPDDSIIMSTQFSYKNYKRISSIYTKVKYKENGKLVSNDITDLVQSFSNNDDPITPEMILLYDDSINEDLNKIIFKNVYNWGSKYYSLKEDMDDKFLILNF
jgi:hypothetical protein